MQNETEIVLANLDWLMMHEGMRLDYAARAVMRVADGQPYYMLDDLAVAGLTPATAAGAVLGATLICTEGITSAMLPRPWEAHQVRGD